MLEVDYRCRCGDARPCGLLRRVVRKFSPGLVGAETGRRSTCIELQAFSSGFVRVTIMQSKNSALLQMHNVAIIVDDLKAAVAFFTELGLEVEGEATVKGHWVDRVVGLEGVRSDIVMLRTPDGHSRLELSKFHEPKAISSDPNAPVNTLGIRRIMFAVTDLDDVVARLQKHGAELVGEVVQYEDIYRLCYLRGPEGIMLALAERLGNNQ